MLRLFVSSTQRELQNERMAAREAIRALGLTPVMFEDFGARPDRARVAYLSEVREADILVGIYWNEYGRPGPNDISAIEDEYRCALACNPPKPVLAYVKNYKPRRRRELKALLRDIENMCTYCDFANTEELKEYMRRDIIGLLGRAFRAHYGGVRGIAAPP